MSCCNQKSSARTISNVYKNSPAMKAGIKVNDELVAVNGEPIEDVFDYRYSILCEDLSLKLMRDGKEFSVCVHKGEEEELGLEFSSGLMDEYRRCKNNCIFCFIDQMPHGMRETLYFKDDDSRLSFLQGNYVTLTNMSEHDVERIVKFKMEPVNISFQTTNPELRCKMLNNRFAGDALKIADRFYKEGITMNGQIVLCKGVNDGEELRRSLNDLYKYLPVLESVSVVPVGLTKYRDNLYPLESFEKEDAVNVISLIEEFQKKAFEEFGLHFVHASDEWYILAGMQVPGADTYDGYLQLENGVGMVRLLEDEFTEAYAEFSRKPFRKLMVKKKPLTFVTGKLAFPCIKKFADMVMNDYPNASIDVRAIRNDFFGEKITVAGLITGKDIINQLKGTDYAKTLVIPQCMLRAGEAVFLDDVTVEDLCKTLQVNVKVLKSSGYDLLNAFIGR